MSLTVVKIKNKTDFNEIVIAIFLQCISVVLYFLIIFYTIKTNYLRWTVVCVKIFVFGCTILYEFLSLKFNNVIKLIGGVFI